MSEANNSFTREMSKIAESIKFEREQLLQKVQQLEQAGNRLSNRIQDVLDNIVDESALREALEQWVNVKQWVKAKEELK